MQKTNEIVYVDNMRLFNEFHMTRDLNNINGLKIKGQKKTLDSLYTLYGILKENGKPETLASLEKQLRHADQQLKQMNSDFVDTRNKTVWARLNTYVSEYGGQHDFQLVLGTQGSGNVMYAREGVDVTQAVIDFANAKYEGDPSIE